jgi:hypothetical protein
MHYYTSKKNVTEPYRLCTDEKTVETSVSMCAFFFILRKLKYTFIAINQTFVRLRHINERYYENYKNFNY